MWKKYPRITAADESRMAFARARSLSAATLLSPMKAASLGSVMPRASTFRPRRSMNPSSEFSSGSAKAMSKPITFAPSRDSVSISAAIFDRGQGQRPSASRLSSSITAIATVGEGDRGPREAKRRS